MKALLLVDSNETIKQIVQEHYSYLEELNAKIEALKKEKLGLRTKFLGNLESELDKLGLITKDEKGSYPALQIDKKQVIYQLESSNEGDSEMDEFAHEITKKILANL